MPPTYTVDLSPAGGGSPEAPVKVPMGGGAGAVTYATGSVEILGNAADAALEILGYNYGLEQTTPLPGKTMAESYAIALAAEINADWSEGGLRPLATVTGATVHLAAGLGGIPGNLINLTSSDANVVPSGSFLTGGGGDSTITVSGSLAKNGSAAVSFPTLAVDQYRASSQTEFSSNGWDYDTGGPPLTGWHYTARIQGVTSGTFPNLILSGYRWELAATRYAAGVFAEVARWKSELKPTSHPIQDATGWAPDSPATGTPTVTPPTGVSASPPHTITMPGTSGGSPSAPATVPMEGAGSSEPTYATATVTVIGNPLAAAVQLRVMGIPYSVNLSAPLPGLTIQASVAAQLATAINANSFAGLLDPTATASGAVITLRAGLPGPGGNLLSLVADTPAFLSLSSANFAGGSGGPTVAVGGTLTKDGTTPVVFPLLSMDSEVDPGWRYSNFGADTLYITPPLTGWEYVLERSEVVTAQVVTGYRWILAAERFVDGSVVESAGWRSPTLPDLHSFSAVTSWAPQGSATGTPILTIPPGAGPAAPATVSMPGTGGGTPGAPATVPI